MAKQRNDDYGNFFNAVFGIDKLQVESVGEEIKFSTSAENIRIMNKLMDDSEGLKANVIHALKIQSTEVQVNQDLVEATEQLSVITKPSIFASSGPKLFQSLLSEDFLTDIEINPVNFQDKPDLKIAELPIKVANKHRMQRLEANISLLRSALSNPELVFSILSDPLKSKISSEQENGKVTEFGCTLISTTNLTDTSLTVLFNYGYMLSIAQSKFGLGSSEAPVIHSFCSNIKNPIFSVNKNAMLSHIYKSITSGLIFKESGKDLLPIAFQPESQQAIELTAPPLFYLLLDISGSMMDVFDEYKDKIITILRNIVTEVKEWEIIIVPFDDERYQKGFSSQAHSFTDLYSFVKELAVGGGTDLNGAYFDTLSNAKSRFAKNPNVFFIGFTDGSDTSKTKSADEVVSKAIDARKANDQFMMFTFEFGKSCDSKFFETMANKGGFNHCKLGELKDFEVLNSHISSVRKQKSVFHFMKEMTEEFFMQCVQGEVQVGKIPVSRNVVINHAGQKYEIHFGQSSQAQKLEEGKRNLDSSSSVSK